VSPINRHAGASKEQMRELMGAWWYGVVLLGVSGVFGGVLGCSSSDPAPPAPVVEGCVSDSDCDSGLLCDEQRACVQCRFDSQCADTQRCDSGQCLTRVSCASSADCQSAAAPACDKQLGECFECVSASDCGPGKSCNSRHNCIEAHACANSAACPSGQVCSAGACTDCRSDQDCGTAQRCSEHQCTAPCAADTDCSPKGLLCDPVRAACVECVVTSDCPSSSHCDAGSCVRDVCQPGDVECSLDATAASVCAPKGDRFISLLCAQGQVCTDKGSGVRCSNWECTPGVSRCSTDGARVEQCTMDGLSTSVIQECGANQVCSNAQCTNVVCTPDTTFCKASAVYRCNADGTSLTRIEQCVSSAFCDEEKAACVQQVCSPGQTSCTGKGNQRGTCKGDGSGYEDLNDCEADELCAGGTCVPIGCTAQTSFCDGPGKVRTCNSAGTASVVSQVCDPSAHCVESGTTASCNKGTCLANTGACDGNLALLCKPDGLGYTDSGTDCAASGKVCSAGTCVTKQCDNGTLSCVSNTVMLCTANVQQVFQTCSSSQYCDATDKSCKPRVCPPNVTACSGQVVTTCNADGSAFLNTGTVDCAASGKICSIGTCVTLSCAANQTFCQGGNVYKCSESGTSSALLADCYDPSQHCVQFGNSAQCVSDVCTKNAQTCSGNALVTCNAEGTAYSSTTDCGAQVCIAGACTPKICQPGTFQCSGNVSQVCNATGTAYSTSQTCGSTSFCADGGKCVPLVCAPGAAACVGNNYGFCNAGGSALASGGTDCSSSGQVCDTAGCIATATDGLSSSTNTSLYYATPNVLLGAAIRASSNRRLIRMQANLSSTAAATLRFLGYVSDTQAGPYLPLFDTSVPLPKGAYGVYDSDPLDVPIVAGKFYFFAELFGSPYYYFGDPSYSSRYLGLGRVIGTYSSINVAQPPQSITSLTTTGAVPDIRLITKAP